MRRECRIVLTALCLTWAASAAALWGFRLSGLAVCLGKSSDEGVYVLRQMTSVPKKGERYAVASEWDVLGRQRGLHSRSAGMVKEIAGVPGEVIEEDERGQIYVNGEPVLGCIRLKTDSAGRALPRMSLPYRLEGDEYFLVSHSTGGWDSRYFGPVPLGELKRTAVPLWIWRRADAS